MVSATDDLFSHDADRVAAMAQARYVNLGRVARIDQHRYEGELAFTQERFAGIVRWLAQYVT